MKKNKFFNMKKDKFNTNGYTFSTVLLKYKDNNDEYTIGTGFIVGYYIKVEDKENYYMRCDYLVSNSHVFVDIQELEITFHVADDNDETKPSLEKCITIKYDDYKSNLFLHPTEDIGIFPLGNLKKEHGIFCNTINYVLGDEKDIRDYVKIGDKIAFFGYPLGCYDTENLLPILRRGYIASVPSLDYSGKKEILIDAHIYKGSSGSPVFHIYQLSESKSELHFIGMISEYVAYNKEKDEGLSIGLGYVIKREVIFDYLEKVDNILFEESKDKV